MPISLRSVNGGGGFPIGSEQLLVGNLPTLVDSDGQKWLKTGYIETNTSNFDNTYWANTRGTLWKSTELDSNKTTTGLAIKDNIVIAVGSDSNGSYYRKSTDGGVTWGASTTLLSGATSQVNDIAYSDSLDIFVTVHADGTIMSSTNEGSTWQTRRTATSVALNVVKFANNTFLAAGQTGTITTSPDGVNWTNRTSGVTTNFISAAYGTGGWLVCANSNTNASVYSSTLSSWTQTTVSAGSSSNVSVNIFNDGTRFLAGNFSNAGVWTSSTVNGTWTRLDTTLTFPINGITYDGSAYYLIGGTSGASIIKTSNFVDFTFITGGTGGNLSITKIYNKDSKYLACGSSSGSGSGRVLYGNNYLYAGQHITHTDLSSGVAGAITSYYYTRIA